MKTQQKIDSLRIMKGTELEFWINEFENKYYARKTMEEMDKYGIHKDQVIAEGTTLDEALSNLIEKLK